MTGLIHLVREDLNEVADSRPVPDGLAERVIAAGYQRRRRRTVLAGVAAVVAAAAVAVPLAVRAVAPPVPPQAPTGQNAFFAQLTGKNLMSTADPEPRWQVLDPRTGRYREVAAGEVSEPSADLRYAAVSPPNLDADPGRIGRYDTTTGEIRWYEAPVPSADQPQISPDGQHVAYWVDKPAPNGPELVVVRLRTGEVTPIDLPAELVPPTSEMYLNEPGASPPRMKRAMTTHSPYPPGDPVGWRLENDRIIVGGAILDLRGSRIGTLPLPDKAVPVSILADGAGALIRPEGQLGVYALTDASGAITHQVTLPICSDPTTKHDRTADSLCTDALMWFAGWRGPDQILVKDHGYGERGEWLAPLDAVDLVTGERRSVYRDDRVPGIGGMVIISADRLSRRVQDKVAF